MVSTSSELLLEIARIKDNIRKKWSSLRNNDLETQRQLEIQYKPLIKPLQKLTRHTFTPTEVKREIKEEPMEEQPPEDYNEEDELHEEPESPEVVDPGEDNDEEEQENEDEGEEGEEEEEKEEEEDRDEPSLPSSEDDETWDTPPTNVDELLAKYLNFIVSDDKSEADFTYGIVYGDNGWMMGKFPVQFINNDIIIRGRRYKGTPGLFELIFKKHPSNTFTEDDLKTYKSMLVQSGAHVSRDGKVISSRGYKYTNIISNMFPPKRKLVDSVTRALTPIMTRTKRTLSKDHLANEEKRKKVGEGIMVRLSRNQIDYRHWDDPNELCERLSLLMASKEAGNTGHDGEIVSILEELKEAGVIRAFNNVRL